jgi:putative peptide zinc metalloprotease protein
MFVWLLAEPGLLRAVAFNTMLVAGVSTLVFNGNPLLRYDAYFILADLIEIPNLGPRANRYLGALLQRWLFRADDVALPPATPGERAWFIGYAITSFGYRTWVSVVIVLFIASEFALIGAALAAWAVCTMLLLPLGKLLHHLATGAALQRVRPRVLAVAGGGTALLLAALLLLPLPFRSQTQGVVWLPEQALVRAGADGVLQRHLVAPGSRVQRGDALTLSTDPALQTAIRVGRARIAELQAQLGARWVVHPVEAALLRQDLAREQAALDQLQQRARDLVVRSPGDGIFQVGQAQDQLGRFHRQGALLGHVSPQADDTGDTAGTGQAGGAAGGLAGGAAGGAAEGAAGGVTGGAGMVVRVVVPQGDVDLVRSAGRAVALRPSWLPGTVWQGTVLREVPAGDVQLPSAALAPRGGGPVVVDPRDSAGLRGMERSFQLDIAVPAQAVPWYGARVHIRFQHPAEPLAVQWWRSLRQAFLRQFPAW